MLVQLQALLHNNVVRGVIAGATSAAVVDLHAVTQFKNWNQLVTYDWGTASFRWFSGALTGGLTAAGLGVIS